jgi:hypothetical protein
MINLFKQKSFRWSILGVVVLIVLGSFLLTNRKTSAIVSDPQRVLEVFLESAKEGNVDKAYSYVTATGISELDLRKKFESDFDQVKLLSYKINKFFSDDATHASAITTIKTVRQGEQRSTSKLIKQDGVWKISYGNYATPGKTDNLNGIDNRPSLAEIYERKSDGQNGKVDYAQPSASPINPINEMSNQQLVELKPVVKKLFIEHLKNEEKSTVPAERRIKNFIVQDDMQILKNDQNTYFIVNYDTLAASTGFVIAGGGELKEDGWVKNRELHVVIQKTDGEYQIKSLSSGP